jgi:glycosyltransferase involved in cell wall biosynthesis
MGVRSPLRVHVLIDSLTWGGAELLLADLAEAAGAHGLELSVSSLFPAEDAAASRLRAAGLEPEPLDARSLADPRTFRRVRRHLMRLAPDLVHTHLQYSDLLGGVAARTLGIPAVATLHVMDPRGTSRERVRARLVALARSRCHQRVIAVSDHVRAAYLAAGADRPEHVLTVHNGVAAHPVPGAGAGVRAELGLSAEDAVIAMIGVLRPGKGHDLAVAAVEEVRRALPSVRLLIVGEGPTGDDVARLAARLGKAAVLAGYRDDVMAVLDAADILLHPSRTDAFPTVLLQGLAAGVPIVASGVGGIPEIVEDGRTALLVRSPLSGAAFATRLAQLLSDANLRSTFAERGRERFAAEFTADSWAGRLRLIYEQAKL